MVRVQVLQLLISSLAVLSLSISLASNGDHALRLYRPELKPFPLRTGSRDSGRSHCTRLSTHVAWSNREILCDRRQLPNLLGRSSSGGAKFRSSDYE
ncbi:hypothetical protein BJ170DRAFT_88843 [Xylariales sp. AK1849]|nr:hypothetical protein BJ170DRAFT_88843 [Xylariales sp. AK1849]